MLKDKSTGEPLPNLPYRILLKDGSYLHGVTDGFGRTQVVNSADTDDLTIEVEEG